MDKKERKEHEQRLDDMRGLLIGCTNLHLQFATDVYEIISKIIIDTELKLGLREEQEPNNSAQPA